MEKPMTTYRATDWEGNTKFFSAWTYSDAYEQAATWANGNLWSFEEA